MSRWWSRGPRPRLPMGSMSCACHAKSPAACSWPRVSRLNRKALCHPEGLCTLRAQLCSLHDRPQGVRRAFRPSHIVTAVRRYGVWILETRCTSPAAWTLAHTSANDGLSGRAVTCRPLRSADHRRSTQPSGTQSATPCRPRAAAARCLARPIRRDTISRSWRATAEPGPWRAEGLAPSSATRQSAASRA